MYQMILIDDEPVVLKQLKEVLDWAEYGFEIAGVFKNGAAALKFMETNHVDAAISDIRMAVMDGLEFAAGVNRDYPHVKVVLVSAYRDFEYARRAVSYNVTEYLVKPLRYEELTACVSALKAKLDSNAEDAFFVDGNTQTEFQKIFSDLFCGITQSETELQKQLEGIGIYIAPNTTPCALVNLHIDCFDSYIKNVWKRGLSRFYLAVSHLTPYETMFSYISLFRYSGGNVELFALSRCNKSRFCQALDELTADLTKNAKEILKLNVSVSVSEVFPSLTELVKNKQEVSLTESDPVDKAIHYIKENYAKSLTLAQVSNYVCLSPVYFSSLFKRKTGQNFLSYLTEFRIEQAREMLKNSNITISSICELVGYKNQTHFYQLFKEKNNGLTPTEYRQIYLEKSEG